MIEVLIICILPFLYMCVADARKTIINRAKSHGILIEGKHYKVYKIYRSSSYTDGGVYVKHHNVKDFGEFVLVSPEGQKLYISESHLRYCLKVRKHEDCTEINGKMTNRWAEWRIDPNGDDERNLGENDVYEWLY